MMKSEQLTLSFTGAADVERREVAAMMKSEQLTLSFTLLVGTYDARTLVGHA
jgi:hypothetical protein